MHFLVSFYTLQTVLFVVQPGYVVHWRAAEGLTPATALRRWFSHDFALIYKKHIGVHIGALCRSPNTLLSPEGPLALLKIRGPINDQKGPNDYAGSL